MHVNNCHVATQVLHNRPANLALLVKCTSGSTANDSCMDSTTCTVMQQRGKHGTCSNKHEHTLVPATMAQRR